MRNKFKQILKRKKREFEENLKKLYAKMDATHPGWQDGPDADYIQKKLKETAKKQMKNKRKIKQKILKKEDFKDWPFVVDEVILVQTSLKWISIIVKQNGLHEYALNGLAKTGKNLKFAHDAGIAIQGKSVGEFIQMGLRL
jgi:hypothetical protein